MILLNQSDKDAVDGSTDQIVMSQPEKVQIQPDGFGLVRLGLFQF